MRVGTYLSLALLSRQVPTATLFVVCSRMKLSASPRVRLCRLWTGNRNCNRVSLRCSTNLQGRTKAAVVVGLHFEFHEGRSWHSRIPDQFDADGHWRACRGCP